MTVREIGGCPLAAQFFSWPPTAPDRRPRCYLSMKLLNLMRIPRAGALIPLIALGALSVASCAVPGSPDDGYGYAGGYGPGYGNPGYAPGYGPGYYGGGPSLGFAFEGDREHDRDRGHDGDRRHEGDHHEDHRGDAHAPHGPAGTQAGHHQTAAPGGHPVATARGHGANSGNHDNRGKGGAPTNGAQAHRSGD